MGSIAAVRQKISDKAKLVRAEVLGDGTTTVFLLGYAPVLQDPVPSVWLDNILQTTGYTIDYTYGVITFTSAPGDNASIMVQLYSASFSDDEITEFLSQASGYDNYAAALALLALSADAAKIARRRALSGGGGLGAITEDTSVTAKELRDSAKAYYDMFTQQEGGTSFPAEGLTEIAWTEFGYNQIAEQDLLRNY